jgi:hypothetical protein
MKLNKSYWGGPPVAGAEGEGSGAETTNTNAAYATRESSDANTAPYTAYGSSSYGHEEAYGAGLYPSQVYETNQQPVQPLYLTGSLPVTQGSIAGGKDEDELTVQQRAAAAMRAKAKSKK